MTDQSSDELIKTKKALCEEIVALYEQESKSNLTNAIENCKKRILDEHWNAYFEKIENIFDNLGMAKYERNKIKLNADQIAQFEVQASLIENYQQPVQALILDVKAERAKVIMVDPSKVDAVKFKETAVMYFNHLRALIATSAEILEAYEKMSAIVPAIRSIQKVPLHNTLLGQMFGIRKRKK